MRTEFLLFEVESFNELKYVIVQSDTYWLKADDELKLRIEIIPVLIVNIIIVFLYFYLS